MSVTFPWKRPSIVGLSALALVGAGTSAFAQTAAPAPAADTDAGPPKNLSVGSEGLFQPGLLMQTWLLVDHVGRSADPTQSTFRLRRAEVHVKGDILPHQVKYEVMFDVAKVLEFQNATLTDSNGDTITVQQPASSISVLQDFSITYSSQYADVTAGQFKIPVSWEGYNSSSKLLFNERAVVSHTFGDKRDIGVKVTKKFPTWSYYAGVFNGAGLNHRDNNDGKDLAVRLEVYPVPGLTIAGVTYDQIGDRDLAGTKDRWEGDVRYESGPLLLQSEFIRGRDGQGGGMSVNSQGFYVAGGFKLPMATGELQPALRVGYFDPNADGDAPASKDEVLEIGAAANYYLEGREARMSFSYTRFQYDQADPVDEVILGAQVAY